MKSAMSHCGASHSFRSADLLVRPSATNSPRRTKMSALPLSDCAATGKGEMRLSRWLSKRSDECSGPRRALFLLLRKIRAWANRESASRAACAAQPYQHRSQTPMDTGEDRFSGLGCRLLSGDRVPGLGKHDLQPRLPGSMGSMGSICGRFAWLSRRTG
jgi:hypothetical protein